MPEEGWISVEFCAFLFARPEALEQWPAEIAVSELITWMEQTELPWVPSAPELTGVCESFCHGYKNRTSDWNFAVGLLQRAAEATLEMFGDSTRYKSTDALIVARRRLPLSSLLAFSVTTATATGSVSSDPVKEVLARGCSDPHVHQGAAAGFDAILRAAVLGLHDLGEAAADDEEAFRVTIDPASDYQQSIRVLPLIAGVAIAAKRRSQDVARIGPVILKAARGDLEGWAEVRDILVESGPLNAEDWPSDPLLFKRRMDDSWSREAIMLALICESVLYRGLGQASSGLEEFVASFNRFATVRKMPKISRHEYIEIVLTDARDRTPGLRHIDLRLGEPVFGNGVSLDEGHLRMAYRGFFSAYIDLLEAHAGKAPLSLTFPLGLIKSEAVATEHWRWDTRALWQGVNAYADVLGVSSPAWALADGIDVCGLEAAIPNWVITPALSAFSQRAALAGQKVSYRFHAGEWQWTPLHGLRRVAEALKVDMSGFRNCRIGHGLALFDDDWSRLDTEPIDELLDDLLYAYRELDRPSHRQVRWRIEREVWLLIDACYGPSAADWLRTRDIAFVSRAYESRSSPKVLQRISNIAEIGNRLEFVDGPSSAVLMSADEVASLHMSPLCSTVAVSEHDVISKRVNRLRDLLSDVAEILRPKFIGLFSDDFLTIEVCPSSNVNIGTFRSLTRHPVANMMKYGMNVAIGTDDPAVFGSWLADEFALLHNVTGIDLDKLDACRVGSLNLLNIRSAAEELNYAKRALMHMGG